jgi:predicted metal-dependent hydrolase
MSHHSDEPIDEAASFHHGLHLFNTGQWFEAHEAWEDIWRPASGVRKAFLQGLIQAAVVIEHIRRGNPRGMRSVWESCQSKFAGLPAVYMGVPVERLLGEMAAFIAPILALPAERFAPEAGKQQAMPVDLERAPTIKLAYDPFA